VPISRDDISHQVVGVDLEGEFCGEVGGCGLRCGRVSLGFPRFAGDWAGA
jgi:hypothetical protein